jgi:hypothetical protein
LDVANPDSWDRSITVDCRLWQKGRQANARVLIDTGASGIGFINKIFAQDNGFTLTPLDRHIDVFGFNGKRTVSGRITHITALRLRYLDHEESIKLFVTTLGHPVILGQPWMKLHKVTIDWDNLKLIFTASRCKQKCLITHCADTVPKSGKSTRTHQSKISTDVHVPEESTRFHQPRNSTKFHQCKISTDIHQGPGNSTEIHEPTPSTALPCTKQKLKLTTRKYQKDWYPTMKKILEEPEPESDTDSVPDVEPEVKQETADDQSSFDTLDVRMIGATPLARLAKKPEHTIFAVTMADIEKALAPKKHTDPATKVPIDHHKHLEVFSRKEADKLAEHRPYDHKIVLEEGKQPGFGPLYGMSRNELLVLQKYLKEMLSKGFIRASTSPVAAPVIFVKKPGGGLRFCVDYRALNAITIKNRYPLPLIQETLNRLSKARYYTKLDLIHAFNRLRIAKGDEWLTAFRTRYGLFEYLVTPFGLANAPSSFQHFVNDTLRPYLDVFCTAYIDDILVYSNNLAEHRKHVDLVLEALKGAGLQLDVDKCEFHKTEVLYLGLVISTDGVRMDPKKIEAIVNWQEPKNVKDVRAFIGFANFYRRFIDNFSALVSPLVALTRKDKAFTFDKECKKAFAYLKVMFTTAPVLQHFDPDRMSVVEADSSDYVTGGILSQYNEEGVLHPVAYFSKRLSPAECNYEIYDKELLAIIRCFEQWRPELEGAGFPIKVLSDHKNLQYFTTTKQLSHRQARWSEYLSRFRFSITYRPGVQGQKPDALTRRSQDAPAQEEARSYRNQTLLRPELFDPPAEDLTVHVLEITDRSIEQIIIDEYPNDEFIQETLKLIQDGVRRSKKISLSECEARGDRLYYRNRLVVPDHDELKLKLLEHVHDLPVAGHPGRGKTLELLQREYYWPNMHNTIRRYVASCHTCRRAKTSRETYNGLLKPLPVPDRRWKDISVDFVVDLPASKGCTNIMVVVDRLSKMRHLIACPDMSAPAVAQLFLDHVWKLHGLPETIISDRGRQFISAFWKELTARLRVTALLSTAFHPETDGQTERVNAVMEQYIRIYTSYLQDDWMNWLAFAEFTANNSVSETTKVSPFLANYGQHPRMGFEPSTNAPYPAYQALQVAEADKFVKKMEELQQFLTDEMTWAQSVYEAAANKNRTPAPAYQVGDFVWLDTRNINTNRPAKKLDWKNAGPYEVEKVISPHAYRLKLPDTVKIHPVFHTSVLRPAAPASDALPGQIQDPPPPVEVDGEDEYFIERIDDIKYDKRKRQYMYLTKWRGYTEASWEPVDSVGLTQAAEDFHELHPELPQPHLAEARV